MSQQIRLFERRSDFWDNTELQITGLPIIEYAGCVGRVVNNVFLDSGQLISWCAFSFIFENVNSKRICDSVMYHEDNSGSFITIKVGAVSRYSVVIK